MTTQNKISKIKDRVSTKTKEAYKELSDGIKSQSDRAKSSDKDYELVFTVRKHHLRH